MNQPALRQEEDQLPELRQIAEPLSANDLLLGPAFPRMQEIADMMSKGVSSIPKHLQGNRADCFAVVMSAMQWGLNPFDLASHVYFVHGNKAYSSQLISAVITAFAPIESQPNYEWFGDWSRIAGKYEVRKGKDGKGDYRVPSWTAADEEGLGVRVSATIRREVEPRVYELLLSQVNTRVSGLWADDPKLQLAYVCMKKWARLHSPGTLMGIKSVDDVEDENPTQENPGTANPPRPAERVIDTCPPETFKANIGKWKNHILAGKANVAFIVEKAKSLYTFTEDQLEELKEAEMAAAKLKAEQRQAAMRAEHEAAQTPSNEDAKINTGPDAGQEG